MILTTIEFIAVLLLILPFVYLWKQLSGGRRTYLRDFIEGEDNEGFGDVFSNDSRGQLGAYESQRSE